MGQSINGSHCNSESLVVGRFHTEGNDSQSNRTAELLLQAVDYAAPGAMGLFRGERYHPILEKVLTQFTIPPNWLAGAESVEQVAAPSSCSAGDIPSAQQKLDSQISGLFSPPDRAALKAMQDALLSGNGQDFVKAIEPFKNDTEHLKQLVVAMNRNLDATKSNVHAKVDCCGHVVLTNKGDNEVAISPDGKMIVRNIETGEPVNVSAQSALKRIAADAVYAITNPTEAVIQYKSHPQTKITPYPSLETLLKDPPTLERILRDPGIVRRFGQQPQLPDWLEGVRDGKYH
jgi:hypothetical protein